MQGFRDPDPLDGKLTTSSPTALRISRIFVLVLTRTKGWKLFTADVTTAFLQGKASDRKLWVMLPAEACDMLGFQNGTRMKLLKSMYGLCDTSRLWWEETTERLLACGLCVHPLVPCLFLSYAENKTHRTLDGAICLHIDDMIGTGSMTKTSEACFATRSQRLFLTAEADSR